MIAFIRQWHGRVQSDVSLDSLVTYLKSSLGYTGSQWEGCIGDLPMVSAALDTTNTSSPAESHFAAYYAAVANNQNDLNQPTLFCKSSLVSPAMVQ
jgi:hypothetical protein